MELSELQTLVFDETGTIELIRDSFDFVIFDLETDIGH